MDKMQVWIGLSLVFAALAAKQYDGYKVVSVVPKTQVAVEILGMFKSIHELDFWLPPSKPGRTVHMMVHGNMHGNLLTSLASINDLEKVETINENVQREINREMVEIAMGRMKEKSTQAFTLDTYHSLGEINAWLDSMAKQYPTMASTDTFGPTYENRMLKLIKIGKPKAGVTKPIFWLDAGIHAREWIAPATALYIINELLSKYDSNPTYKSLVDNLDFYILPSLNADGYAFTWDSDGDRLWRKTRTPYKVKTWYGSTKTCYGADPNRNWDFHWGGAGTSSNPCDDTYDGPNAFSEKCAAATSNYLKGLKDRMVTYISLHSYSELWMYSYGYAAHTYPKNIAELWGAPVLHLRLHTVLHHANNFDENDPIKYLCGIAHSTTM